MFVTVLWLDTYMNRTQRNHPMANDGSWAKIADKTYRHISGVTVAYDHNAWMWKIDGREGYKTLSICKVIVESRVAA